MSTHVHRAGAHRIVVQDETGREVTLVSQDHTLEITTSGAGPRLTPRWRTTWPTSCTSGPPASRRCEAKGIVGRRRRRPTARPRPIRRRRPTPYRLPGAEGLDRRSLTVLSGRRIVQG